VINILPDYVERIRGDISLAQPMQVVVDCGNGVAGVWYRVVACAGL
jgi:phosphomannomutase/phosphoglucomutase